jgi:serine/threonine-protein kinase PpkA
LVSHELQDEAPALREAGASAVLFKDALSQASLVEAIERAVITPNAAEITPVYGQFPFRIDTERYVLGIERYEHLVTLSSNHMAQVFYVERIQDRRPAVVKIATSTPHRDADIVQRFCDRYAFFSRLAGRGVVRYIDAGIAGPWPYVVLEYLSKGDLRRRMDKPVEPGEAARVLHKLLNALSGIHDGGFAHLDIKPENIFFREDGDLALIDFNISLPFGQVPKHLLTGEVLGSPDYMSPEQGQGMPVDGRSDLYSAGVVFFEMLTGTKPYSGKNTAEIIFKHIHDEVPLLPKAVRHLQPLIDGLMAKNRDERYASAAAAATALQPFLSSTAN